MSEETRKKLLEQLDALKIFPNNKLVRELRKKIQSQLDRLERIEKPVTVVKTVSSNISRSTKLKKYHRYLRMIRDNFPNLKYSDIRKQFSERRKGQESDIPDVIWQNPSP